MEKAKREKLTTRTGKAIGQNGRATISITVNDENREVSRFLEVVKKNYSNKKITAAEAYRIVVMRGLACVFEEISLNTAKEQKDELERLQGSLF